MADKHGIGAALGISSGFFLMGAILIFTLPVANRQLAD
jgi:hypothetical protein